jgi:hypothetical protein
MLGSAGEVGETLSALPDQGGGLPQVQRPTFDHPAQPLGVGALPAYQVSSEVAAQQVEGGIGRQPRQRY